MKAIKYSFILAASAIIAYHVNSGLLHNANSRRDISNHVASRLNSLKPSILDVARKAIHSKKDGCSEVAAYLRAESGLPYQFSASDVSIESKEDRITCRITTPLRVVVIGETEDQ